MSGIGDKTNLQQPNRQCMFCKYWISRTKQHLSYEIGGYCKLGYCKKEHKAR